MVRRVSARPRPLATSLFLGSIAVLLFLFTYQAGSGDAAPRPNTIPVGSSATPTACVGYNGGPWTEMAPFPYGVFNAAGVSDGTYYYLFDNFGPNGTSYRYDPVAQSWTRLADMPAPGD